jgi:hypothetical protein
MSNERFPGTELGEQEINVSEVGRINYREAATTPEDRMTEAGSALNETEVGDSKCDGTTRCHTLSRRHRSRITETSFTEEAPTDSIEIRINGTEVADATRMPNQRDLVIRRTSGIS